MSHAVPVPALVVRILALRVVGLATPAAGIGPPMSGATPWGAASGLLRHPRRQGPAPGGRVGVFVAGLEGSLHHFWGGVFDACVASGECVLPNKALQTALWLERYNETALGSAWSTQEFDRTQLLYLNYGADESELSYPNGVKRGGYPQLLHYANAAKDNGDMLKVLVSLRFPDDILASVQYRFGRPAETLIQAADALLEQLQRLDREFPSSWKCISAGSIFDFSDQVDEFLTEGVQETNIFPFDRAVRSLFNESYLGVCLSRRCIDVEFQRACARIRDFCYNGVATPGYQPSGPQRGRPT
mmetsp:Transcript_95775/g.271095  ORF Transcript_95775/g.271095 Transcript_95775/m.271095 type:complete len:301 (+) Transcript_95775:100-1002(+)